MAAAAGSRREFLTRVTRGAGGAAVGGVLWAWLVREQIHASPFALRPPGALAEPEFLSRCIKCGLCVADCPYGTLKLARVGEPYPIGTPYFTPRQVPCYMCPDIPCVAACPTGALDPAMKEIERADMGLAVLVDQETCLSYNGLRCEICYRECPLQGEAITVEYRSRQVSKHAMFIPIVHSAACTGCGICERSCPLPDATIRVFPRRMARGRPGDHYGLPGDDTPLTQQFEPAEAAPLQAAPNAESGLEYLNEGQP